MAPPKASWLFRIQNSGDFLGINWTKAMYKAPYTNNYPGQLIGGSTSRRFSSPLFLGHHANRTGLNTARQLVLFVPTILLGLELFFNLDYFTLAKSYYKFIDAPMPEEITKQQAADMALASRNLPGVMAKHHYGGMVSIPGSEKFVTPA
jgi:hypothetical protein